MLSEKTIKNIKEKLLVERKLLITLSSNASNIDTDGDETDAIQANILIGINNQLSSRNAFKIKKIDNALSRINDSTYGVCQDCEEEIAEKRLLINPYFLTCISCAEALEMQEKQRKKY